MPSARRLLAEQCKSATLAALEALGGTATRAEIRAGALRDGGFTEEQLAIPGPPSKPQFPTLASYYIGWSLSWLKKEGVIFNVGPGIWSTSPGATAAEQTERERRRAEYRRYRETPEWQVRRAEALEAAGHRCQLDRRHEGPLDVHHNNYERLGHEVPEDLIVLCRECHGRHHGHELAARRREKLMPAADFDAPLLIDVAERHAELMGERQRRSLWSRLRAA